MEESNLIYVIVVISYLLLWHFLGDFVYQTDAQAKGKSTSWAILYEHVQDYTLLMFGGSVIAGLVLRRLDEIVLTLLSWALLNGVLHFCIDAVTSRINSQLYRQGRIHAFFVGVGFDQFLHFMCLIWTAWWFGLLARS